jgi:catechol 2,3-dioxygenase-like lactoylglutathione lyase family enzyme
MAISELNHINIRTDKMEETKDFFVDVVGLSIGFRPDFDSHGYWLYCDDVAIVHLSLSDPDGDPRTVASGHGEGLDHIGLAAHDLSGTEQTLAANDVTYKKCLAGGGRLVQVFFHDPNGVQVELAFQSVDEGVTNDNFVPVDAPGLGV